jgi:hypothetical protein
MDFLQAAHKQFEDIAKQTESTYKLMPQKFTRLDLSQKRDIYTYYRQRLESLGHKCLTNILKVWILFVKSVPLSSREGDNEPHNVQGTSDRLVAIVCVPSVYAK